MIGMITLKYLRSLDKERLEKEYKYNRDWQLKWFGIYEDFYRKGVKDRETARYLEYYTNAVNKIKKVMNEK